MGELKVSESMSSERPPERLRLAYPKALEFQGRGALYTPTGELPFRQLHGKPLPLEGLIDLELAWRIAASFEEPAAVLVKRSLPRRLAAAGSVEEALSRLYRRLCRWRRGKEEELFHQGMIGLNRPVSPEAAQLLTRQLIDGVIAPGYGERALEALQERKGLPLIEARPPEELQPRSQSDEPSELHLRSLGQGWGVLAWYPPPELKLSQELKPAGRWEPSPQQGEDLLLAWRLLRWAPAEAAVVVKERELVGLAAYQATSLEAVELALRQAGELAQGAALAAGSPFDERDPVDLGGVFLLGAILVPRGGKRDPELIRAADEHHIALVFA